MAADTGNPANQTTGPGGGIRKLLNVVNPLGAKAPGFDAGSTGNASRDAAFAAAAAADTSAPLTTYDVLADVYGTGVVSSTPVYIRYRPSAAQIVSTMGDPAALKMAASTVGSQMQRLYAMDPQQVAGYQRKLFEGGFYSNGMEMSDITPGVVDSETAKAWYGAVVSAARYSKSGKQTTVEDVIDMTAQALDYQGSSSGGGGGGGGAAPYQPTRLTDPASLRAMADQISTNLLGRRLTEAEKTALVSKVHGAETGFYNQVRGQAQTLTDVDPQAQMQENIKQDFQPEYEATNVANTYDIFSQIIKGGR